MVNNKLELFNNKVVCPLCDGNGLIYRAKIEGIEGYVYICDECEALWEKCDSIRKQRDETLMQFLERHGINPLDKTKFIDLGYDWVKNC